jgi:hypothetical protein
MEHIPQSKARQVENGAITAWEYEIQNANLNVSPISIRGRYPDSGFTRNLESDAVVHVIEGSGILGLNNSSSVILVKSDQLHLAVGDTYYLEGNLDIIYAASPAWTPEQTEHID